MNLLHRIGEELAVARKRIAIKNALERLSPRALADLDLERREIPAVARLGARLDTEGASLAAVIARLRTEIASQATQRSASQPQNFERYVIEAHQLRAEATAAVGRWIAATVADFVRPAVRAVLTSGPVQQLRLELVWRRAYRQLRTELGSYSERELMSDLRLTRAEIDEVAAEGADERLHAHIAADPALRRATFGLRALHRSHGRA